MDFFDLNAIHHMDAIIRVIIAALLGAMLGLDRDIKNKPVDFRAYMIVCVATCLIGIMALELNYQFSNENETVIAIDIGKLISGALTGIGFLGAGAIMRDKDKESGIVGTSTGASIWGSAIIGLCLGFGYFFLALLGFFTILITLFLLGILHKPIKTYQEKNKR
jgi:putative Mg2+ transporter-C (MgtC) family protein